MRPETLAIHHARRKSDGGLSPAINLSTTFEHGPANEPVHGFGYIRDDNPNVQDLETRLAALDGAGACLAFASGMAAASAVLSTLPRGSTVLFHTDIYFAVKLFAETILPTMGLNAKRVDMRAGDALAQALTTDVSLVWMESPTNPTLDLVDIAAVSALAHQVGARVLVDTSFAPPPVQTPLTLGADYVLHALTKYIGGHSDVQGGAVSAREPAALEAMRTHRLLTGGVLAPFNAWLAARGAQTLHCRMERHSANALAVAQWLEAHPRIARVRYPFLPSNPDYDLARTQMRAGGGMLAFDVESDGVTSNDGPHDSKAALAVAARVKLLTHATRFGGAESLIEHRASVEGDATNTPKSLLRVSVGLEHTDDLIADLEQALR